MYDVSWGGERGRVCQEALAIVHLCHCFVGNLVCGSTVGLGEESGSG